MIKLTGKALSYALDEKGRNASVLHTRTGHEWMEIPGDVFKLIYSVPGTERVESVVWQQNQEIEIKGTEKEITLSCPRLIGQEGRVIDAELTLRFAMEDEGLSVTAELLNRDETVILQ